MWFTALATDYDGTLARDGTVIPSTLEALEAFKKSGRRLILVTGRRLNDLQDAFAQWSIFDLIVAENGALLYITATKEEILIAPEAPAEFVQALTDAKVTPLEIGRSIIATRHPNENIVLDIIRRLGLEHQVIFNKSAVMVLPPGVNKATGLEAALAKLGLSRHNVVGVGDAQNDLAFLTSCECAVAVANSLPSVIEVADITTKQPRGEGVEELMSAILDNDLENLQLDRHGILIGTTDEGEKVFLNPRSGGLLIAGTSGSGKSTAVTGIVERLGQKNYQFGVIDPEGDFEILGGASVIGNSQYAPTAEEAANCFNAPSNNEVINLLGVPLNERPAFLGSLMPRLKSMRDHLGRPHWIIIDEAHHMLPKDFNHILRTAETQMTGVILITVHPEELAAEAVRGIEQVLITGQQPREMLEKFAETIGVSMNFENVHALESGEAYYWKKGQPLSRLKIEAPHAERRRHLRKYAEGDVGMEKSFFFRGPEGALNLRVQNLILFVQVAEGVDDATWMHHLRSAEYSNWFATAIKDEDLAAKTAAVEEDQSLTPAQSRKAIRDFINERYTASATGLQLNSEKSF